MDALALLCTLHAEGPRTLRLLREAGCRDVRDFLALDSEVVAALLDVAPAVARRLSREGRHLSQRIGSEFLEPEDGRVAGQGQLASFPVGGSTLGGTMAPGPSIPGARPAEAPAGGLPFGVLPELDHEPAAGAARSNAPAEPLHAAAPTRAIEPRDEPRDEPPREEGRIPVDAYLNRSERQILDKVLERWRESERDPLDQDPAPGGIAESEGVEEPRVEAALRAEAAPPASEPPVLHIDGVPEESLAALRAAGYATAAAVRDASAMTLAGAIGCAFGDARRFQFLASRAVQRQEADEAFGLEPAVAPVSRVAPVPSEPSDPALPKPIAETDLAEHLIERPPVPNPSPVFPKSDPAEMLGPGARPTLPQAFEPAAPARPERAPDRAEVVPSASPNGPVGASQPEVAPGPRGRTVLNWDFVAPAPEASRAPEPDVDEDAGGPFA